MTPKSSQEQLPREPLPVVFRQDGPGALPQELLPPHNYSHLRAAPREPSALKGSVESPGLKSSSASLQRRSVRRHPSSTYRAARAAEPAAQRAPVQACSAPRGPVSSEDPLGNRAIKGPPGSEGLQALSSSQKEGVEGNHGRKNLQLWPEVWT